MKKYIWLLVISLLSGLIYIGINEDARSNEVQTSVTDGPAPVGDSGTEEVTESKKLSFSYNPDYSAKTEFEEWVHSDLTKLLSLLIIFIGSTLLTRLTMKNDLIKMALFSGVYYGTMIAMINNMIFVYSSNKWCLQFLIEYQLLGLFLGLLAGGNAIFMIKYKKQLLTPVFRTFAYMWGIFF